MATQGAVEGAQNELSVYKAPMTAGDGVVRSLSASASPRHAVSPRATGAAIYHAHTGPFPFRTEQSLMNWERLSRRISNVIPAAASFAWVALSFSLQAQTGRIYTSEDYNRAASLLNAGTLSLVDHAIFRATFIGNDRFWYLDSEHGLPTL